MSDEQKKIVVDVAGAMNKITPELMDAMAPILLDPMVKALEKRTEDQADRIKEMESDNRELALQVQAAVGALTQIERVYYEEVSDQSPETIIRKASRMNGIARDAQNRIAELKGGE